MQGDLIGIVRERQLSQATAQHSQNCLRLRLNAAGVPWRRRFVPGVRLCAPFVEAARVVVGVSVSQCVAVSAHEA